MSQDPALSTAQRIVPITRWITKYQRRWLARRLCRRSRGLGARGPGIDGVREHRRGAGAVRPVLSPARDRRLRDLWFVEASLRRAELDGRDTLSRDCCTAGRGHRQLHRTHRGAGGAGRRAVRRCSACCEWGSSPASSPDRSSTASSSAWVCTSRSVSSTRSSVRQSLRATPCRSSGTCSRASATGTGPRPRWASRASPSSSGWRGTRRRCRERSWWSCSASPRPRRSTSHPRASRSSARYRRATTSYRGQASRSTTSGR